MPRAKVTEIRPEGIVAERLGGGDEEKITVAYDELFLVHGGTRYFPALARRGADVVRMDDVIQVERLNDGTWSRRTILERALQGLEPGSVVSGHIVEFRDQWIRLSIEGGIPARAPRESLERFLEQHREVPDEPERRTDDKLKIGDPVSGYLVRADKDRPLEVDIIGHLKRVADGRLERRRLKDPHLQSKAPHAAPPRYSPPARARVVSCPKGLASAMVIENDVRWVRGTFVPWLRKTGARVIAATEQKDWNRAFDLAEKNGPEVVFVDLFLQAAAGTQADGWRVVRELVSPDAPWAVVAMTEVPLEEDGALGTRVRGSWGPVRKKKDMAELAEVVQDILSEREPPPLAVPTEWEKAEPRRDEDSTLRHIAGLMDAYCELMEAEALALFGYDIPADAARLTHSTVDKLSENFTAYQHDMHKSQIRDLAYSSADRPYVGFPRQEGRSWYWMRKLFSFAGAQGVRVNTPDRDKVWSLFAFYGPTQDPSDEKKKRLLFGAAAAIEDARWHEYLEDAAERDRHIYEKGQRIREIAHEVIHSVDGIRDVLDDITERIAGAGELPEDVSRTLGHSVGKCNEMHELTLWLLRGKEPHLKDVGLADLLGQCVYPYAVPERWEGLADGIQVLGPAVSPAGLCARADKVLLSSVVDNLLRNALAAVRATRSLRTGQHRGYGQVCVEAYPDGEHGEYVKVCVHDTGRGISRYVRSRMWERDFSVTGGTGLGMPICHSLVEAMGGSLHVACTSMYVGTTFEVRLLRSGERPNTE